MPGLADLDLRSLYKKGKADITADFYLPCMRVATDYARAVGYFRSSVFILAWPALREFVERGGRIRILCSQFMAKEDVAALDEGYGARARAAGAALRDEVRAMLRDDRLRAPTRILAALVADGTIDLRVALLDELVDPDSDAASAGRRGLFHLKVGIFRDAFDNRVVFHGSMNETWNGLAPDGNLESIYVDRSWRGGGEIERIIEEEADFEEMWRDEFPTIEVIEFPEVARDVLVESKDPEWRESLSKILASQDGEDDQADEGADDHPRPGIRPPGDRRDFMPHQRAGLESWAATGRRGILAFVTGGGKTFTAIAAIREAIIEHKQPVVVVVPDRVLFQQWREEIEETLRDLGVLTVLAGDGHEGWRNTLGPATGPGDRPRLVLATIQTASSPDFLGLLRGGPHLMLVVDEVHRAGAPSRQALLRDDAFGARLGLSATPERAGDADGTRVIMEFFGGVLEPRYSLADALRDKVLTPYTYDVHTVYLADHEMEAWAVLAKEIAQLRARAETGDPDGSLQRRIRRRLIDRARIVKQAEAKVERAVSVLLAAYEPGQRWLVYCDDQTQMNEVAHALTARGIRTLTFHSQMEGARAETLRWLDLRGGVVVAIKCLDEGVDIPSVTHALILASSKNPREFIQRRGRVLRKSPGKVEAAIHDLLVLAPRYDDPEDETASDPVLAGELGRALEFAEHAVNPRGTANLLDILVDAKIDWRSLVNEGSEDDGEEE